jgi:phage gpG-like protein
MIPVIEVNVVPIVKANFTDEMKQIMSYQMGSVLDTLAQGGKPPWARTKARAIARLHDRFANTIHGESDETSATIKGGGTPDAFAHQFGADFLEIVTPKQRGFFWKRFYDTGDEMWKAMALSKSLHIVIPQRSFMEFQEEDKEYIANLFKARLIQFVNAKEATFGSSQG